MKSKPVFLVFEHEKIITSVTCMSGPAKASYGMCYICFSLSVPCKLVYQAGHILSTCLVACGGEPSTGWNYKNKYKDKAALRPG